MSRPGRRAVRRALVTVAVVLALALGLPFGARALQHTLAYHPSRTPLPAAADVLPGAEDVTLTTRDGLELRSWFVPPSPGAPQRDQAVLFAHGNGGALSGRARLGAELADRGFAVLMLGYRGFTGNPGTPSEQGLVLDALAGQRELAARGFAPESTLYLGESIGTGVVAGLAAQVPPAGLVLRSPFTAFEDVAGDLVPLPGRIVRFIMDRNVYPVAAQVAASDVPVTVIQGSADELVPPAQSDAVAAAARHLVEHLVVEGARHNDGVWLGPTVADAVARIGDYVKQ
ncbi:alpha/beta hydrolase [Xylanimonas ulmi]|uniref:Serine aminopeptidase S33 domain-containing protein n=1 Tax=Xylanimonas ulmi TaxID=228973 RepID=A0A4Q7M3S2_9MICO|nr:alpha/beta hydrolase [Xylanibacterium ulmi]RZS61272.1 hypothetical protein EV386_1569 [Xylanibacterium ulmi]